MEFGVIHRNFRKSGYDDQRAAQWPVDRPRPATAAMGLFNLGAQFFLRKTFLIL